MLFIGHYKGVSNGKEFYSAAREHLDFPTQVIHSKDRYLLNRTIQVTSSSQMKNVRTTADELSIEHDVEIG